VIDLDLLIHHIQIADVFRLRVFDGWVGIRAGRFVYVEAGAPPTNVQARETRDLGGRVMVPGLVDSHMHIESSHVTPRRFAQAVLPHGTTTVLADAHEVANVAGAEGVQWMIRASQNLPLRIYHAIPSCVPATAPELEWTRTVFDASVITRLAQEPAVIALGELMDYRGVLQDSARLRGEVEEAHRAGLLVEGHVPTLQGTDLSQYVSWRVTSDHTLTFPEKIREQLSKGLAVMLQTKSCTRENMAAINELVDRSHILLVTDDIEPSLLVKGHLSLIVQLAIQAGMAPIEAMASATIRPARYLGLRDLGGVAPGFRADFLIMDALATFPPREVFVGGERVAADGSVSPRDWPALPGAPATVALPGTLTAQDFRMTPAEDDRVTANAVVLVSATASTTDLERIRLRVQEGQPHLADALALVSVVARDGSSKSVGIIKDFGIDAGAVASTFAHDSHNLLVVGRDATDMAIAANEGHCHRAPADLRTHQRCADSRPCPRIRQARDRVARSGHTPPAPVSDAVTFVVERQP
jgi:adenine deaminase